MSEIDQQSLASEKAEDQGVRAATASGTRLSVTLITGDMLGVKGGLPIRGMHELGVRVERRRSQPPSAKEKEDSSLISPPTPSFSESSPEFEFDEEDDDLVIRSDSVKGPSSGSIRSYSGFAPHKQLTFATKSAGSSPMRHDSRLENKLGNNLDKSFAYDSPSRNAGLNGEERRVEYDKNVYIQSCGHYKVPPVSYFVRHMYDDKLELRHHGLGDNGIKPICLSLLGNSMVREIDLSDNGIGPDGGISLWDMISENIFITHIDLSKNPLGSSPAYMSKLEAVLAENSQITELVLSSTDLNDEAAPYLAKIISVNSKLERLSLSHNKLGEKAGELIGKAIGENGGIVDFDLSWNAIRGKGMKAVFDGLRKNIGLRKLNLSWNGFGSAAEAQALSRALKENLYLQELNISRNRLTPEHAVLIGKGLVTNTALQTLIMGNNPLRTAGCYAICNAVLKNPDNPVTRLDFTNISVNNDFRTILQALKEKFPEICVKYGPEEVPLKPRVKASALTKLLHFLNKMNIKINEFFERYDQDGSMSLTHDEFRVAVEECGINMTNEEIDELIADLDRDGDGDINYTEMIIGASSNDKSKPGQPFK